MSLVTDKNIDEFISEFHWSKTGDAIAKEFTLKDFASALAFVVKTGIEAEKADHHPDIRLFAWNKVKIQLSTHSEGGVTEKDISLAKVIEKL